MIRRCAIAFTLVLLFCPDTFAGRLESALVNPQQAVQSKVKAFEKSSEQQRVDLNNDLITWQGTPVNTGAQPASDANDDALWPPDMH